MLIVYLLKCRRRTYIGATKNLPRRLRQHRKEIKGGARYTGRWDHVELVATVRGFDTWQRTLSYEWHAKRKRGPLCEDVPEGVPARSKRFAGTIQHPKFKDLPLVVTWHSNQKDQDGKHAAP